MLFSQGYSHQLSCFGNLFTTKFAICIWQDLVVKFPCLMSSCIRAIIDVLVFSSTALQLLHMPIEITNETFREERMTGA